ncbi:hypothetical protein L1049_020758 [Liquidambar formosana]|uniref:Uncharacterized protein n=1 Tax=Liquidambar formosana TaxID=63359 RepID=A0AAP0XA47_LIQFO
MDHCRSEDKIERTLLVSIKMSAYLVRRIQLQKSTHTQGVKSCLPKSAPSLEGSLSDSKGQLPLQHEVLESLKNGKEHSVCSHEGDASQPQAFSLTDDDNTLPPPPSLEFKAGSEVSMSDIQKNLQSLCEYNVRLRENVNGCSIYASFSSN